MSNASSRSSFMFPQQPVSPIDKSFHRNTNDDISQQASWVVKNICWEKEITDIGHHNIAICVGDTIWGPSSVSNIFYIGVVVKIDKNMLLVQGQARNIFFANKNESRIIKRGEQSRQIYKIPLPKTCQSKHICLKLFSSLGITISGILFLWLYSQPYWVFH